MKAKASALIFADLGVTKSHSRPCTSNDYWFSESHFKTFQYHPQFPERFGRIQDAKAVYPASFDQYSRQKCRLGIGLITPDQVN